MTSTASSFKISGQILAQLKRYGWLLTISLIVHLLAGPFLTHVMLWSRLKTERTMGSEGMPSSLAWDLSLSFHQAGMGFLFTGAILTGVMLAVVFGTPLKNKSLANFTHALPVRRGQWLLSHALTALLFYGVILLGVALAYGLLYLSYRGTFPVDVGVFANQLALVYAYFFLSYALTALAGMLTGHILAQLGLSFLFHVGTLIFYGAVMVVFETEWDTFRIGALGDLASKLSVPGRLQGILVPSVLDTWPEASLALGHLAQVLGAAVVAMLLAWWAYRAFPLERVSNTVSQAWVAYVIKAYFIFWGSLLMGAIFSYSWEHNPLLFGLGMVIGAVLVHVVAEIALRQSTRAFRQGIPFSLLILGLSLLFYASVHLDLWGYDRAVPDAGRVTEVSVQSVPFQGNYYDPISQGEVAISDPAFIADAVALSTFLADHHLDGNALAISNEDPEAFKKATINLDYDFKGLGGMNRSYQVLQEEAYPYVAKLYNHASLWQATYASFYDLDPAHIRHMTWTAMILPEDGMSSMQGLWQKDFSLAHKPNQDIPQEDSLALIAALQADLQTRSLDTLHSPLLAEVHIQYDVYQNDIYTGTQDLILPVYAKDRHTFTLYQDWVDRGLAMSPQEMLAQVGATRMEITGIETEDVYYASNDPQEILDWVLYQSVPFIREGDQSFLVQEDRYLVLTDDEGTWVADMRPLLKEPTRFSSAT